MTFKYIELFAGIGGFRSALDGLGGECVFASEIDKYASQAYRALYDGAPELHGDITQIDAHDIPDHDVLVGGFPCQAFSVAGQRKGFEDARGTLFFEIARIASTKQPRLMLLENVKGLLSHDGGKTFETMCVILNDIGYAIDFRVLNSKHFGVPQNRERIFVACDRDAEHAEWNVTGNDVVAKAKRRAQALGVRTFNFDWPENIEVSTRLRDVLETHVDEKYYLSEEKTAKLIAQLSEKSGDEPIVYGSLEHYGNDQMNRVYSVDGLAPTITVVSGGGREQKIAEPQEISEGDSLTYALTSSYGHKTQLTEKTLGKKRLTYVGEPQLEQYSDGSGLAYTVDANYAKGTSPGDIGKGRRTHVMEEIIYASEEKGNTTTQLPILRHEDGTETSSERGFGVPNTLQSEKVLRQGLHGECVQGAKTDGESELVHGTQMGKRYEESGDLRDVRLEAKRRDTSQGLELEEQRHRKPTSSLSELSSKNTPIKQRYRIRKLTPKECWRLQGFSDAQHDAVMNAGISDSQRYKQAGNAVTVNVIRAVGRPLVNRLKQTAELAQQASASSSEMEAV